MIRVIVSSEGKMNGATLDLALDVAMQLPEDQREMLLDILKRRDVEARRKEIAADARVSLEAYRAGKFRPQSAGSVIRELRSALETGE
jgi:hypothetical protein